MIEVQVYKQDGTKKKKVNLPEELFSLPWNDALIHQVITSNQKNKRQGSAHTKDRSVVSGGGKKPWKQKGTGRARHGSIRSPIWVGGGVTFGPNKNKSYSATINKKMKAKAFFTILSQKVRDNEILFIDKIEIKSPSTKQVLKDVEKILENTCDKKKNICTVVLSKTDENVIKSFSNIKGVNVISLDTFSTLDVYNSRKVLFVDVDKTLETLVLRGKTIKK